VEDPELPLDSELYVAAQPITGPLGDPWLELTQAAAGRRYRQQVRRIVHRLRRELGREVRLAEARLQEGLPLTITALSRDRRLSPLGCYIAAHRMGRADLARGFALAAAEQHRACPLYMLASRSMLPADRYPADNTTAAPELTVIRPLRKSIVMN
jgi:hypothetical protein